MPGKRRSKSQPQVDLERFPFNVTADVDEVIRRNRMGERQLLTIMIMRADVEAGRTKPVLDILKKFSACPDRTLAGLVDFCVDGYNHDERELCEISEVCEYYKSLASEFPYLFYFLNTNRPTLKIIALCVCDAVVTSRSADARVNISGDDTKLSKFVRQQFQGLNRLIRDHELDNDDPKISARIGSRILNYFDNHRFD